MDLYFAYGSNLKLERMRARVASAQALRIARLFHRQLSLDKRGRDGSGKANVSAAFGACVWGVVYRIELADWSTLDRYEPGYARVAVEVQTDEGDWLLAETYVARDLTPDPVPWSWYKRLIVDGAREHGLPPAYVAQLLALPER